MQIYVNIRLHPRKIREMRDLYGIDAESDVYKDFFDIAVSKVVESLLKEGFDSAAVRRAMETYRPEAKKILEMAQASDKG